jgi:hypothetical protein
LSEAFHVNRSRCPRYIVGSRLLPQSRSSGCVRCERQPSLSTIFPLTRGNRIGAWAWQYSALLYWLSFVSHPGLAHTRPRANRLEGRVMPLIAAPLTVSVICGPPGLGRHFCFQFGSPLTRPGLFDPAPAPRILETSLDGVCRNAKRGVNRPCWVSALRRRNLSNRFPRYPAS